MKENHQRVVYYGARHPFLDAIKIGTTTNLANRLVRLQKSYGEDFNYLTAELDHHGNERVLALESQRHQQFRASHIVGEWFWLTDDLRKHIESLDTALLEELLP